MLWPRLKTPFEGLFEDPLKTPLKTSSNPFLLLNLNFLLSNCKETSKESSRGADPDKMTACLVQQLFRGWGVKGLDAGLVIETEIIPLLREEQKLRRRRKVAPGLMLDIWLMAPNAISVKGSIFEVEGEVLEQWRTWEPLSPAEPPEKEAFPEWTIHPLYSGNTNLSSDELELFLFNDGYRYVDAIRDSDHQAPEFLLNPWEIRQEEDGGLDVSPHNIFAPSASMREILNVRYATLSTGINAFGSTGREGIDLWDDTVVARISREQKDPILWGLVDIINHLREISHPLIKRDFGYIWLREVTDHDLDKQAYARAKAEGSLAHEGAAGSSFKPKWPAIHKARRDIISEDKKYVNDFLEDALLNGKPIYWNKVVQWGGEGLLLSK